MDIKTLTLPLDGLTWAKLPVDPAACGRRDGLDAGSMGHEGLP